MVSFVKCLGGEIVWNVTVNVMADSFVLPTVEVQKQHIQGLVIVIIILRYKLWVLESRYWQELLVNVLTV